MLALYLRFRNWLAEKEEGQDLVEYALIIVLIALLLILALGALRGGIENVFNRASTTLNTVS